MDKLKNLFYCLILLIFTFSCSYANKENQRAGDSDRPNIIYILVDDMGYGDLSRNGQTAFSTPNIDRMAREGISFSNHYTGSSVCAPSRATLMTGLHTGHVSVRGNQSGQLLSDKEVTIAEILKKEGYYTGIIGKWGIGHPPEPDDPQRNGFDYSYGYINMFHAHNFYPEFLYRNGKREIIKENKLERDDQGHRKWAREKPEGTGVAEVRGQHTHQLFEKDAISFIKNKKDQKFFLYLALNMPHANNEHPTNGMEVPSYNGFEGKDWPDQEKGFAMMMKMIDDTMGRLFVTLKEEGLDQNTIVFFASDNGPHQEGYHKMEFFNSNGHLRGMKRDFYDGGVKTPFFVRWPGIIAAGSESDHLSSFWDFLPTICEIVDSPIPGDIDGISYLPTLLGDRKNQKKHQYLYWEFYEQGGKQALIKDGLKAIKLNVRTERPFSTELYDLKNDPQEERNIAEEFPVLVEEMEAIMQESHIPLKNISLMEGEGNIQPTNLK